MSPQHPQLYVYTRIDVRDVPFADLIERLIQRYPMAFGFLLPHDSECALWYLQRQLGLGKDFCSELYQTIAISYGLHPSDITNRWIQQCDITIGELHERLWFEANMADVKRRWKPYLR